MPRLPECESRDQENSFCKGTHLKCETVLRKGCPLDRAKCSCGKPGTMKYDNGLCCGIHCDDCFDKMVAEARSRSW